MHSDELGGVKKNIFFLLFFILFSDFGYPYGFLFCYLGKNGVHIIGPLFLICFPLSRWIWELGMGGLLLGMGWGVDDGAGKQASGVNRLRFLFFLSLFGFRAFHLFSSILLCYRLVYFIFHSFCLFLFLSPTSSSNQSLIHIYQVGRRTVWMPTANYHSLLYSTAFSCLRGRGGLLGRAPFFCFAGTVWIHFIFREGVYFYFCKGSSWIFEAHSLFFIFFIPLCFFLSGSSFFYGCH